MRTYTTISSHVLAKCACVLLTLACGGGRAPEELTPARYSGANVVRVDRIHVGDVGLISDIAASRKYYLAASASHFCQVPQTGVVQCTRFVAEFDKVRIVKALSGNPSAIVGTNFSGKGTISNLLPGGRVLWKTGDLSTSDNLGIIRVHDTVVGIATIADGRLVTINAANGQRVATYPIATSVVDAADLDDDGDSEILCLKSDRTLLLLNGTAATTISSVEADEFVVAPTAAGGADRAVSRRGDSFVVLGSNLRVLAKLVLPQRRWSSMLGVLHLVAAARVVSGDSDTYAVALAGRGGWHRSILLLFDARGNVVYDEVLDDDIASLVAGDTPPALLVGIRGAIRRYTIQTTGVAK